MNAPPMPPPTNGAAAAPSPGDMIRDWVIVTLANGRKIIGRPAEEKGAMLILAPAFDFVTGLDQQAYRRQIYPIEFLASCKTIAVVPTSIVPLGSLDDVDRTMLAGMIEGAVRDQAKLRAVVGPQRLIVPGRA